jgi:hypothetical protein
MVHFHTVKLFDMAEAPEDVIDAARSLSSAFVPDVGEQAVWEVRVGECEWSEIAPRNAAEAQIAADEALLHRWLADNGASRGEAVIVKVEP